jgi:hypothetical protein
VYLTATAHLQLRCSLWIAEAAIITICAITAVQIATEKGGSIWACGPIAIIAVMESMRVPLSGWAAHLRPVAMFGALVVMAAISLMTFEGMSMAVERFIHQRVIDVYAARKTLDEAQHNADDYKAKLDQLTGQVTASRDAYIKVQGEKADTVTLPNAVQCGGGTDKHGRKLGTYACDGSAAKEQADNNRKAIEAHEKQVADARKSLDDAEAALKALPKPDDADLAKAEKALEATAAGSTMYRVAATWFGTPVNKLTQPQFERFKAFAVFGLAGAVSTATMVVSFVSYATPRDRRGTLVRAIRAYFARKRKNVVRTVVNTVEKPVEKIVEVEKHVIVDRPIVVEKRVDVPGPERVIVKHRDRP